MEEKMSIGLWLAKKENGEIKRDKNGNSYLRGKFQDGKKIIIFKNSKKINMKHPDYNMIIEDGGEQNMQYTKIPSAVPPRAYKENEDEECPF